MDTVNDVPNRSMLERMEGQVTPDVDILSLKMSDDDIAEAIGNRVAQSEKYWNTQLKLDSVRKTADSFYFNNYYSQDDLYDFQIEYKDNRLFVAIETLVALVVSNPPMPLVQQAYDTDASYELAQNLQKALLCKYEELYLKGKFQMIARHLLMGYRLGVMKYRWDDTIGQLQPDGKRFGDITVDAIRPQRIVLDAGCQYIDDIPLIAEYRSAPLEELCEKYPDKKDEIMVESGKKAGSLTDREGYLEIHFTTYQNGQRIEAVAWKYKKLILNSTKSPYWNYDETYQTERGETKQANFLTRPTKPYVLFNFLNVGKWVLDDTSLMDQAIPMQKIANKIGRQIVENAEQANSGTIWNSLMVADDDVAKLLGDPGEKVMSKGDVSKAAAKLPYNDLANYVISERMDAREEIDNIFATHGALRGEITRNRTLGQSVMSQRGDAARIGTLATSIESSADRLYKGLTQCFKVFYDVPQLFRYTSEDSLTAFFTFGRDNIEDNVGLKVKTGSILPTDPAALKQETMAIAALLDPLNLAKGLNKQDPKEWAKQVLMYRMLPDQYMQDVLDMTPGQPTQDPNATTHLQMLSNGQSVQDEQSPSKNYLSTLEQFIQSPKFQQLPLTQQQSIMGFAQRALDTAKKQMGLVQQPGSPTEPGSLAEQAAQIPASNPNLPVANMPISNHISQSAIIGKQER